MGFSAQVQSPQTSGGKGQSPATFSETPDSVANQSVSLPAQQNTPQGKASSGQRFTYSPTSGQPAMGQPNRYANTISQWDNASIQRPNQGFGGKGKG
jgi:hypothetical protein